jgi:hypothetical protein
LSPDYKGLNFTVNDPSPGSGAAGLHAIVTVGGTPSAEQFVPGATGTLPVDPSFSYIEYWAEDLAGNQSPHSFLWNYPNTVLADGPAGYWRCGRFQLPSGKGLVGDAAPGHLFRTVFGFRAASAESARWYRWRPRPFSAFLRL